MHFIDRVYRISMIERKTKVSVHIKEKNTFKTRIDVYETLCPQQMLVHKGGKIKNWGGECRDVTPTKLQSQNIFKESTGGGGSGWGGGQDGCERRIIFFVKIQKTFFFFFFLGGGGRGSGWWGGGVRVDVNEELKFL